MRTEGYFTADEIMAAVKVYHATRTPLMFGRTALTFPSMADYEEWATEQARLHPERWSHAMKIQPRRREKVLS